MNPQALMRAMTPVDRAGRQEITDKAEALAARGLCPTCTDLREGGIYPSSEGRTFYEDDLMICLLEQHPRNPGHTVLLLKPHYEDIAALPVAVGLQLLPIQQAAIVALKDVLGAEKIYVCTMCDGERNHLHLQFIPRLPGDRVRGSKLFTKERNVLTPNPEILERLRARIQQELDG